MIPEAPVPDGLPARGLLSVVIPVWREEKVMLQSIRTILGWPEVREIIVVAVKGESSWLSEIESAGARCVFADEPNRGRQLNLGARSGCFSITPIRN
jgi:glycosyltransferase involved in cell wall biosynthesis